MQDLSIGDVAKMLEVTPETLRNWEKTGKLVPYLRTESGQRRYSKEQVEKFLSPVDNVKVLEERVRILEEANRTLENMYAILEKRISTQEMRYEYIRENNFNSGNEI